MPNQPAQPVYPALINGAMTYTADNEHYLPFPGGVQSFTSPAAFAAAQTPGQPSIGQLKSGALYSWNGYSANPVTAIPNQARNNLIIIGDSIVNNGRPSVANAVLSTGALGQTVNLTNTIVSGSNPFFVGAKLENNPGAASPYAAVVFSPGTTVTANGGSSGAWTYTINNPLIAALTPSQQVYILNAQLSNSSGDALNGFSTQLGIVSSGKFNLLGAVGFPGAPTPTIAALAAQYITPIASQIDYIYVEGGTNDVAFAGYTTVSREAMLTSYYQGIQALAPQATLIIQSLTARNGTSIQQATVFGALNDFIYRYCLNNGCIFIDAGGVTRSASGSGQFRSGPTTAISTPTYVNATQFTVVGNQTATLFAGIRVVADVTGGIIYGVITASSFSTTTLVTVLWDTTPSFQTPALDAGLNAAWWAYPTSSDELHPNTLGSYYIAEEFNSIVTHNLANLPLPRYTRNDNYNPYILNWNPALSNSTVVNGPSANGAVSSLTGTAPSNYWINSSPNGANISGTSSVIQNPVEGTFADGEYNSVNFSVTFSGQTNAVLTTGLAGSQAGYQTALMNANADGSGQNYFTPSYIMNTRPGIAAGVAYLNLASGGGVTNAMAAGFPTNIGEIFRDTAGGPNTWLVIPWVGEGTILQATAKIQLLTVATGLLIAPIIGIASANVYNGAGQPTYLNFEKEVLIGAPSNLYIGIQGNNGSTTDMFPVGTGEIFTLQTPKMVLRKSTNTIAWVSAQVGINNINGASGACTFKILSFEVRILGQKPLALSTPVYY